MYCEKSLLKQTKVHSLEFNKNKLTGRPETVFKHLFIITQE